MAGYAHLSRLGNAKNEGIYYDPGNPGNPYNELEKLPPEYVEIFGTSSSKSGSAKSKSPMYDPYAIPTTANKDIPGYEVFGKKSDESHLYHEPEIFKKSSSHHYSELRDEPAAYEVIEPVPQQKSHYVLMEDINQDHCKDNAEQMIINRSLSRGLNQIPIQYDRVCDLEDKQSCILKGYCTNLELTEKKQCNTNLNYTKGNKEFKYISCDNPQNAGKTLKRKHNNKQTKKKRKTIKKRKHKLNKKRHTRRK